MFWGKLGSWASSNEDLASHLGPPGQSHGLRLQLFPLNSNLFCKLFIRIGPFLHCGDFCSNFAGFKKKADANHADTVVDDSDPKVKIIAPKDEPAHMHACVTYVLLSTCIPTPACS